MFHSHGTLIYKSADPVRLVSVSVVVGYPRFERDSQSWRWINLRTTQRERERERERGPARRLQDCTRYASFIYLHLFIRDNVNAITSALGRVRACWRRRWRVHYRNRDRITEAAITEIDCIVRSANQSIRDTDTLHRRIPRDATFPSSSPRFFFLNSTLQDGRWRLERARVEAREQKRTSVIT